MTDQMNEALSQLTASRNVRTSPVTVRAALARRKRRLGDDPYAPLLKRTTPREASSGCGRWMLLENNIMKDGFDDVGRLTDYLQETGVLARWEYLVEE